MSIIQGTSKSSAATYEIEQSIRFNDEDSARLERTVSSSGSTTTWTTSVWVKRGKYTVNTNSQWFPVFSASDGSTTYDAPLSFNDVSTGGAFNVDIGGYSWRTSALARDTSAWYHVVTVWDSNNGTTADRMRLYINGQRVTDFSSSASPSSGANSRWNSSSYSHHRIGNLRYSSAETTFVFDGYLAEINFIDGTALDATSFGETHSDTGQWVPKKYTGSYGNNGFYITGEDSSDLGDDESGNGNDFTSSGLAAADQMSDSPTNNFCVMSPLDKSSAITTSDGNLTVTNASTNSWNHGRGTLFAPSGKWYYEWTPTAGSYALAGWMTDVSGNDYVEEESDPDTTYYRGVGTGGRGVVIGDGSPDTGPANFSNGDVVMMAIDVDTMKFWVGVNGTWYNSGDPANGTNATGTWTARIGYKIAPWYGCFNGTSETFNFGASSFAHTIPTGFNSWSPANLPDPTIALPGDYFNTVLYTGNGATGQSITGVGFQPDWVWTKIRSPNAYSHQLFDAVRGAGLNLQSNNTNAEGDISDEFISFDSDGFTIDDVNQNVNESGSSYVSWNWKANGSGSSNTTGSINTTATSANTTSGFSISTFTGNGTSGATFGHGLGVAPKMVIIKERSPGGNNWKVGHIGAGFTKFIPLDTTSAAITDSAHWNDTAPSSTVVTLGNDTGINENTATYVAYCFAEVEGFSKFGSYTGNGSTDGVFVHTGFKVGFLMYRRINAAESWEMYDNARGFNVHNFNLKANLSNAEGSDVRVDLLSNGFKARSSNTAINNSGDSYIYMAFASSPFKTANAQ